MLLVYYITHFTPLYILKHMYIEKIEYTLHRPQQISFKYMLHIYLYLGMRSMLIVQKFVLYIIDCLLGPYEKIRPEVKLYGPSDSEVHTF